MLRVQGGDAEAFKVKKSSLSRKLALGTHPASAGNLPTTLDQASISSRSNGGPIYDQAYLSELKASTSMSRPTLTGDISYDADISMDVDASGATMVSAVDLVETEMAIPSQSSVLAAKQKRERLRGIAPADEDFISLSVTRREDTYQGPHPESRLVREEDELGEAEDEFAEYTSAQERIALGKKSRKAEAGKRRGEMIELIAEAEEVDEETAEWEQEQLRRGGMRYMDETERISAKPVYKPMPIPPMTAIPALDPSMARLTQLMTNMTTSHAQNAASVASLAAEHERLDERETEMREMIAKAEAKRSWFAAFREWVESVATFLDAKFPELEKLEDEHVSILKERRDMIHNRRHADDEDDLSTFLGTLPVTAHTEPEELDELGRVVPRANPAAARRDRQSARVSRRLHRRQRQSRPTQEEEGYSTDASLPPSHAADYQAALQKLSLKRDNILSDVKAQEFRDPSLGIGKWFAEWRQRFGDSYTGAWGGLGLIAAWEFWVRLEILGWSPFEDSRTLDNFAWFEALHDYSRPRNPEDGPEDEAEPELGPDGDLVSAMISTAVIPRLSKIIQGGGLDPFASTDIRRLIHLAEEIETSVEKSNLKFQVLLKAIISTFQEAIAEYETTEKQYLALNQPRFDPESVPARLRLLARQRKLLTNLLRWRKYTGELFGIGELVTKLIVSCMLPVAESGWDIGGEDSMRKVATLLPAELVPSQLRRRLGI
ncbi:hypothetical protein EWM64_g4406 [Hericium alpestre]|uniref:GCF C-terminal domain-containing protein n=1 Tax=Hericium alpestre TaxID=135208 RepID=A0A4Z0A1B5_9AGAM|nr:hypothetical protein EWM64_g4406 [Hericium alpestre]